MAIKEYPIENKIREYPIEERIKEFPIEETQKEPLYPTPKQPSWVMEGFEQTGRDILSSFKDVPAQIQDIITMPSRITGLPHPLMVSRLATETVPYLANKATSPIGTFPLTSYSIGKKGIIKNVSEISPTPLDLAMVGFFGKQASQGIISRVQWNAQLNKAIESEKIKEAVLNNMPALEEALSTGGINIPKNLSLEQKASVVLSQAEKSPTLATVVTKLSKGQIKPIITPKPIKPIDVTTIPSVKTTPAVQPKTVIPQLSVTPPQPISPVIPTLPTAIAQPTIKPTVTPTEGKVYYTGGKELVTDFTQKKTLKTGEEKLGTHFTTSEDYAKTFAGKEGKITQVNLDIKKPYEITKENELLIEAPYSYATFIQELKDKSYDAIVLKGQERAFGKGTHDQVFVLDPSIITLSTPTEGKVKLINKLDVAQNQLNEAIKKYGYGGISKSEQHPAVVKAAENKQVVFNGVWNELRSDMPIGSKVIHNGKEWTIRNAEFDTSQSADMLKKGSPTGRSYKVSLDLIDAEGNPTTAPAKGVKLSTPTGEENVEAIKAYAKHTKEKIEKFKGESITQQIKTPQVEVNQGAGKFYAKIENDAKWISTQVVEMGKIGYKVSNLRRNVTMDSQKAINAIKKTLKKVTKFEEVVEGGKKYTIIEGEGGFLDVSFLKPIASAIELSLKTLSAMPQAVQRYTDGVQNIVKDPLAKELVSDVQNINLRAERDRADALVRLDYLSGLTPQEDLWLTDLVEGRSVDIPNKEQFNKLWVLSRKVKKSLSEVWNKASTAGVKEKITDETGTKWIPIRKVENYVPREISPEVREKLQGGLKQLYARIAELKNQGVRTNIKQAIMEAQQSEDPYIVRLIEWVNSLEMKTTPSSVIRFLDKLINRDYIPSYGHLERPRTADMLPPEFYERRASVLFNRYFAGAARRIAEVDRFGSRNEKLLSRLAILEKRNPQEGAIIRELIKRYRDITGHELSSHLATGISIMKIGLGTSVIPNITQTLISTIPKQGVMNFLRGAFELVTKPEIRMMVKGTGIPYQNIMNELMGFKDVGALSRVNDFLTKFNGFQGINRLNALLTAASTKSYIEHTLLPRVNSKTPIIRRWALSNLQALNIAPTDIVEGKIPEGKMIDAMLLAARDTQLFADITTEPLWLSDPRLRGLWVLKRFGYKQPLFVIHKIIYDELKHGNPIPLLRLIAGGLIGGAFVIWANRKLWDSVAYVKATVTGEAPEAPDWYIKWDDEDRKIMEVALDLFAQAGTVGALSDITRLDAKSHYSFGRNLEFQLTPVALSELWRSGELVDVLLKGTRKQGRRNVEIPVEERLQKAGKKILREFPITKYFMEKK